MSNERNTRNTRKRFIYWLTALALALGIGATASGALAGRLTDTTAGLAHKSAQAARPANPGGTDLVISQVYGGGGNSGAQYRNDFIEVFNPTGSSIVMSGWSVQYNSATGTGTWQVTALSGTLPPGGYFLVQEAAGTGMPPPLPTPDAIGTIAMSGTAGKVALVNSTTALTGSGCPFAASVVDFVGYGATANCFEGTGPTAALSNTTSGQRAGGGCTDTDNNNTDFSTGAPNPRNSASPLNPCVATTPTDTPTVTDTPVPTDTPTATDTPTDTDTPTVTNTPTDTDTPTNTPTDTDTPVGATDTPTDTPTVTDTPTDTPTYTPTDTHTDTPTSTDTPTVTNTSTSTPTVTQTNTRTSTATHTTSTSVVISEFRTRGPNGGNDEFIELYNLTGSPIDISGWKINGSSACGATVTTRLTIANGTILPPYGHFLAVNNGASGYSGSVTGDATYNVGITDSGGIGLLDNLNFVIDAVGMCATTTFVEGTFLPPTLTNINQSYERKPGGGFGNGQDTEDNFNDFTYRTTSEPENLGSPPEPPVSTHTPTDTPTATETPTETPTDTPTATETLTNTPTDTPTDTPVVTDTPTETPTETPTDTPTVTDTPTNTPTDTPTDTPTSTPTNTALPALIVGHVTWQGCPGAALPITLTLKMGATEVNYPSQNTDTSGFFTVTADLPNGSYNWRVKGPKYLANAGTLGLVRGTTMQVGMGFMRTGDTNDDNMVNVGDFTILRNTFGKMIGEPGYDDRANFNCDTLVNTVDYNFLRLNFGMGGAPPIQPGR